MANSSSIEIVVSCLNQRQWIGATIASVLAQSSPRVRCHVVDGGSTDGSQEALQEFAGRAELYLCDSTEQQVATLNRVFTQTQGDIMAWLDAGDRLCPWACDTVSTVFRNCHSICWLTGGIPVQWTRSQFMIAQNPLDGFSHDTFLRGRNLKSGPDYRYALPRAGIFWRRALWEQSGANVKTSLAHAGDFELWTRFWKHSDLVTLKLPLGGAANDAPPPDKEYWNEAARFLRRDNAFGINWLCHARARLLRLAPRLAPRFATRARFVRLTVNAEDCVAYWRTIV